MRSVNIAPDTLQSKILGIPVKSHLVESIFLVALSGNYLGLK